MLHLVRTGGTLSSYYNLPRMTFREASCSRVASLWWDQGAGVDPTPKPNPDRDQTGLKKRVCAALRRFRIERENSPTILNVTHAEVRTRPRHLSRQTCPKDRSCETDFNIYILGTLHRQDAAVRKIKPRYCKKGTTKTKSSKHNTTNMALFR